MNNKKVKINVIFVVIVILLIVTALMIRFEFNPISYFMGENKNNDTIEANIVNNNGVYRYRDSLDDNYKLFSNCSISYYDYYIVVLNDDYYRYKSSCVGTFLLDEGKVRNLKIEENLGKNKYIMFDDKQYLKTELVNSIEVGNYYRRDLKSNSSVYAETYHILLKEAELPGSYFDIPKVIVSSANSSYNFRFDYLEQNRFKLELYHDRTSIYSQTVDDFDKLPLFRGVGVIFTIINPAMENGKYNYELYGFSGQNLVYNLKDKFPITVDGVTLNYEDNIYIKYSASDSSFILLVSKSNKFCEKNSESTDIAYYIFQMKYNYLEKNFDNPKFIKKVYKNEGCSYVNELMED